jgi:hypothetical protein
LLNRASSALLAYFVVVSAFSRSVAPELIFVSPCECQGFHGKNRWVTKTDLSAVPSDKSEIQSITPSQIYAWEGPGRNVDLTRYTEERMPPEQKWYALTGRLIGLKAEADGDIHMELEDATGNAVGTVSAEIPVGPKWCEIRQTVFGWTTQSFPFSLKTSKSLKLAGPRVITVIGKAFMMLATRPRTIQTDEASLKVTPCGKFIR